MWAKSNLSKKEKILYLLVALSALLYLLEGAVPRPLPWMKLGFANIITVIVIYFFDFFFLMKFIAIRVLAGSLITATLFTPSFFLSSAGAVCSGICMFLLIKIFGNKISPLGLSVAGAVVHLSAQTLIVYLFIINDKTVLSAFPLIFATGLISGSVTGYISSRVILELESSGFGGIINEI